MNTSILFVFGVALFVTTVSCRKGVYQPDFEYQADVIERLVRLEIDNDKMNEVFGDENERIVDLIDQLEASAENIRELNATINFLKSQNLGSGSTYIRWGRTTCDGDAKVVYTGVAAGAYYGHSGSGTNYLCLTNKPKWGRYDDRQNDGQGLIYGVEYEFGGTGQNEDAPCVACSIPRSNVVMTPGSNECEEGWNLEYWGHLVSQAYNQNAKEFVCLDNQYEFLKSGHEDHNGGLFYFVEGRCGSLACPPFVNYRELSCSVCSYGKQRD